MPRINHRDRAVDCKVHQPTLSRSIAGPCRKNTVVGTTAKRGSDTFEIPDQHRAPLLPLTAQISGPRQAISLQELTCEIFEGIKIAGSHAAWWDAEFELLPIDGEQKQVSERDVWATASQLIRMFPNEPKLEAAHDGQKPSRLLNKFP